MSRLVIALISVVAFILLAVVVGAFRSDIKKGAKWAWSHTLGRLSKKARGLRAHNRILKKKADRAACKAAKKA